MTLWGSHLTSALTGFTGDTALPSTVAIPGMNVARLASNPLIDIQGNAGAPMLGGGQRNIDKPVGPFEVTLTPITNAAGAPLAATNLAANFDWGAMAARVVFGRGGTKCEAWVDWPIGGGRFLVKCDTLSVNALALSQETGAIGTDWNVRCGAWATPVNDAGGGGAPPRYTMRLPNLANGGGTSGEVFIPPFARRWHWQWNNLISAGAWNIAFLFRRNSITFAQEVLIGGSGTRGVLDATDPGPWELPTGATSLVVNNNTVPALTVDQPRIVFDLDLA